MALTRVAIERALTAATSETWLTDTDDQRLGCSLVLRIRPGGRKTSAAWGVRYTLDGRRRVLTLGPWPALSIRDARRRFDELLERYVGEDRDLHAVVAAEQQAEREARQAQARRKLTLGRLVEAYAEDLEGRGKGRWAREVRALRERHLSALSSRPAEEVTPEDVMAVLVRLRDEGHERTADLVRSMLRTAYQRAIEAAHDPRAPSTYRAGPALVVNPVAAIRPIPVRPRDRVLADRELRALLSRLAALDTVPARAVLAAFLLGGQRPSQLLRLEIGDVREDAVTIRDGKGRRSAPRAYDVPLVGRARELVHRQAELSRALGAPWVFTTAGQAPVDINTASALVRALSREMVEAGDAPAPFRLADLRRTAETLLARLGVPRDVRAHLMSHGLGGVQMRHYDRHEYTEEKRDALERLAAWYEAAGKVVALPVSQGRP